MKYKWKYFDFNFIVFSLSSFHTLCKFSHISMHSFNSFPQKFTMWVWQNLDCILYEESAITYKSSQHTTQLQLLINLKHGIQLRTLKYILVLILVAIWWQKHLIMTMPNLICRRQHNFTRIVVTKFCDIIVCFH